MRGEKSVSPNRLPTPRKIESTMLTSGEKVIQSVIDGIGRAKHSIDMQVYAFEADETGKRILHAFEQAKARNPQLRIRFVVDNSVEYLHNGRVVGRNEALVKKRDETNELLLDLRERGILDDVKVTNWFNAKRPILASLRLFSNVWHRDHKKLFLMDARDMDAHPGDAPEAIVGSANVTDNHASVWKDGGRLFTDKELIRVLSEDFEDTERHAQRWKRIYDAPSPSEYWEKYGRGLVKRLPFSLPELVADGFGSLVRNAERRGRRTVIAQDQLGRKDRDTVVATDSFYVHKATREVFDLLDHAQKGDKVNVATPYPGFFILSRHLTRAAKRGVDVNLIIPGENNHILYNPKKIDTTPLPPVIGPILRKASHANLVLWRKRLWKSGVTLFEYDGKEEGLSKMLHFKGATLERRDKSVRSINGSPNLSKGILSGLNREVVVATESDTPDGEVVFMDSLKANATVTPGRRRNS